MPTELAYDCINGVAQPYLPLPEPFTAHYRLTLLEETDLSTITKILSQSLVAQFLRNVPQPYTIQDAQEWYKSQPSNVHFHNFKYRSEEEKKLLLCFRFPFSVIRSKENDELVGYLSIRRNEWEWMEGISPTERKKLRKENDAKIAGDKSISYSIVASKGLMTAVTTTALQYAMQYMNARYIQGTFRADNIASKRVLEKNGFAYLCEAKMPVRGGKEELEIVFNKTLAAE